MRSLAPVSNSFLGVEDCRLVVLGKTKGVLNDGFFVASALFFFVVVTIYIYMIKLDCFFFFCGFYSSTV